MRKISLYAAVLLGIIFDVLFWEKTPGISFAIFTMLCLACGYALLRLQNIQPARLSWLLIAAIIFSSAMTFVRKEPFTMLAAYALSLFGLAVLAITYRSGLWLSFGLADYMKALFALLASLITTGWRLLAEPDPASATPNKNKKQSSLWPILRGLLLAVPMLIILTGLLSSADLIFAQKVRGLLALVRLQNLSEIFTRALLILLVAYALAGVFWHAANRSQDKDLAGTDRPTVTPFLGSIEATVILVSIMLLFSAFVLTQFQYFFSGQANISLEGFTYSEYARRGFGELLAVAVISLVILQGLNAVTKVETSAQRTRLSALGLGLIMLVIIILVSSFQRLRLYEAAYGFSRLRVYARVFTLWLGALLAAAAVLQVLRRQRAFAAALLISAFGFGMSLSLLNVDAFIAHRNVLRAVNSAELDAAYLASLSPDAVPTLAAAYSSGTLSGDLEEEIGAVLACFSSCAQTRSPQNQPWQSFHLSDWRAARSLAMLEGKISTYQVDADSGSVTLNGKQWDLCGWQPVFD